MINGFISAGQPQFILLNSGSLSPLKKYENKTFVRIRVNRAPEGRVARFFMTQYTKMGKI
jgi:hypothetical protein